MTNSTINDASNAALSPYLVQIDNLHFERGEHKIFSGVQLNIARNKITAIMGPSGSGKTTLLKLISAQLYPSSGTVLIDDVNVHQLKTVQLYKLRRKMGMLFQSGALFTNLDVFENVAFPLREHTDLPDDMINDLVIMLLEIVGLRGARNLMSSELSGGMARRVALARALILNPNLMMYDEPFTGQDPITLGILVKLIKKLNDTLGLTSIIVSHDIAESISIADYVYVISESKIIGEGTAQQILCDENPAVKQFMQGLPDGTIPFHYPTTNQYFEDLGL